MPDAGEAWALHEMGALTGRLRLQLSSLIHGGQLPPIVDISTQTRSLVKLITVASDQFHSRARAPESFTGLDTDKAMQAFSDALAPLSGALGELGQAHSQIAHFHLTEVHAYGGDEAATDRLRAQTWDTVARCFELAGEALETVVNHFEAAATELMPPEFRAARTRSTRAFTANPSSAGDSVPPSAAPIPATDRPTKTRS
ncbi:hypothetical protein ACWIG4_24090 [Streptomyces sp. NPDC002248]